MFRDEDTCGLVFAAFLVEVGRQILVVFGCSLRLRLKISVLSYSTDAAVFRMTIEHFSPVLLPQFG